MCEEVKNTIVDESILTDESASSKDAPDESNKKGGGFKQTFFKCVDIIKKYIETDYYIFVLGFIITLFSVLGLDLLGLSITVLLLSFSLVFKAKTRTIIPPLFMICYCLSTKHSLLREVNKPADYFLKTGNIVIIAILVAILYASTIYALIKNKTKIKITPNFWGFALISFAFLTGGLFSRGYTPLNLLVGLLFTLTFLGSFVLFSAFVKKEDFNYIAKVVITGALVATVETAHLYLYIPGMLETFEKGLIQLGWGISNAIGIMIVMGMPFVIYFMSKSKYPILHFLLLCLLAVGTIITFARASLLVAAPVCVGGSIYSLFKLRGKQRTQLLITGIVFIAIVAVFVIFFWDKLTTMLNFYIEVGFDDRGRTELYELAGEKFITAPILGVGFLDAFGEVGILLTFYHNTFAQFLATSGIIGLICYIAHLLIIAFMILKTPKEHRSFLGLVVLMITVHSLFDCVIYYPYLTFIYTIAIALAENTFKNDTGKDFKLSFGKLFESNKQQAGDEGSKTESEQSVKLDANEDKSNAELNIDTSIDKSSETNEIGEK